MRSWGDEEMRDEVMRPEDEGQLGGRLSAGMSASDTHIYTIQTLARGCDTLAKGVQSARPSLDRRRLDARDD
eukprot:280533-Prymnesium_polylepis.2